MTAFIDTTHFVLLLVVFTVYPILASRLLRLYKLQAYGTQSVLAADLSLSSDDPDAEISLWTYQVIGLPFIVLYVFGIPMIFAYILKSTVGRKPPTMPSPAELQKLSSVLARETYIKKRDAQRLFERRLTRYSFLSDICSLRQTIERIPTAPLRHLQICTQALVQPHSDQQYALAVDRVATYTDEERCWWWELTELARKLVLTSLVIFVPPPGSTTQIFISGLVAIGFLVLSTAYTPFKSFRLDIVNFNAQLNTSLTLMIMLALRSDIITDGFISTELLNTLLLQTQLSVGYCAMVLSVWILYDKLSHRRKKNKLRETAGGALTDAPPPPPVLGRKQNAAQPVPTPSEKDLLLYVPAYGLYSELATDQLTVSESTIVSQYTAVSMGTPAASAAAAKEDISDRIRQFFQSPKVMEETRTATKPLEATEKEVKDLAC